jgi:hypothetical protein
MVPGIRYLLMLRTSAKSRSRFVRWWVFFQVIGAVVHTGSNRRGEALRHIAGAFASDDISRIASSEMSC